MRPGGSVVCVFVAGKVCLCVQTRAASKDYFVCRLIYLLFFRFVTIIFAASVSTLVLPHILRPMKHAFENTIF